MGLAAGKPARVLDTDFFRERETFDQNESELGSPVLDFRRRRVYLAGFTSSRVYAVDLPSGSCDPPAFIRAHLWSFDGTFDDLSGSQSLSSSGNLQFVHGLIGRAVNLAEGSLHTATSYTNLDAILSHDGTVMAWIKPDGAGTIAEVRTPAVYWKLALTSDLRPVLEQSGELPVTGTPLHPGQWRHISLVAQGEKLAVHIDGGVSLEATRSAAFKHPGGARTLSFGPFQGVLDEAAIYDRALTPVELQEIISSSRSCLTGGK